MMEPFWLEDKTIATRDRHRHSSLLLLRRRRHHRRIVDIPQTRDSAEGSVRPAVSTRSTLHPLHAAATTAPIPSAIDIHSSWWRYVAPTPRPPPKIVFACEPRGVLKSRQHQPMPCHHCGSMTWLLLLLMDCAPWKRTSPPFGR